MRGTAKLIQARSNEARATINFLLLHKGVAPLHTALPVLLRWNLGEGGPLCTKQASQHSIFDTVTDYST